MHFSLYHTSRHDCITLLLQHNVNRILPSSSPTVLARDILKKPSLFGFGLGCPLLFVASISKSVAVSENECFCVFVFTCMCFAHKIISISEQLFSFFCFPLSASTTDDSNILLLLLLLLLSYTSTIIKPWRRDWRTLR